MNVLKRQLEAISPARLEQPINALFLFVIVLQAADALSTYWALSTGQAHEKNLLLVAVAHYFQVDVLWVVMAAKILVAAVFILALQRNKPTWTSLFVMFGMAAFYLNIVADNIALTWKILEGRTAFSVVMPVFF